MQGLLGRRVTGLVSCALVLLAAGVAAGCGVEINERGNSVNVGDASSTRTSTYEISRRVDRLRVVADAGDIEVVGRGSGPVRVTEEQHYEDEPPRTHHGVDGHALGLGYECSSDCWVDYRVEVPAGVATTLRSGAGDVTLRGLTGRVAATTGAGSVDATGLRARHVTLRSDAGDVAAGFAVAPGSVKATSSAGGVTLRLPDTSYAVRAATTVGDKLVGVRRDPDAPRTIRVETRAGDVRVLHT